MPKIKHLEGKYKTVSSRLVMACDDAELRLYLVLKFHAIEKHDCFPKIETLFQMLNWSRNKLIETIKLMEKKNRLVVERNHRKSNIYDITWYDLENEMGFLGSEKRTQLGSEKGPKLGSEKGPQQLGSINNKEITTIPLPSPSAPGKEVNELIAVFRGINPTINFGNKTIRGAANDAIKMFGQDKAMMIAKAAVSVQGKDYAPVITTPYELMVKYAKLKIYLEKERGKLCQVAFVS